MEQKNVNVGGDEFITMKSRAMNLG